MARFAPLASLAILKELHRRDLAGRYHLFPASQVLEDPEGWGTYRPLGQMGRFVMVSPSTGGRPLEPAQTAEAAKAVAATAVLLPSYDGNMQLTVSMALEAAPHFEGRALVGVIQGRTEAEYLDCANTLRQAAGVSAFAIPASAVQRAGSAGVPGAGFRRAGSSSGDEHLPCRRHRQCEVCGRAFLLDPFKNWERGPAP
jgi:hypothetical protein